MSVALEAETRIAKEAFEACCACGSRDLAPIADLPAFPHVGVYLENPSDADAYPPVDNALSACAVCGHLQLGYAVDPGFLYTGSFQHRTSQSANARQCNEFLFAFAQRVCAGKPLDLVAEIGCNDTFLLRKFAERGVDVAGVDPILKGRERQFIAGLPPDLAARFHVVGDFVERADFAASLGRSPDLYVSNMVFEHLKDPFAVTRALLDGAGDGALFIVAVPGAEFMLTNCRFDQLSHQHYHRFTVPSFRHMIERAGGEIVDIAVNYVVWGQILIAFRKGRTSAAAAPEMAFSLTQIEDAFALFRRQIATLRDQLDMFGDKPAFGFGAAQNFPPFAYFYGAPLPFDVILDDDPKRQNRSYPGLPVRIEAPGASYEGAVGLLTGPDHARALVGRMDQLRFDHVIVPFLAL